MIGAYQRLKEHSRFLLILGPDDAGDDACFIILTSKYLSFQTRVKFCTQEILFFRQDLLYRMRRSCLMPPSTEETTDPFEHLVATITHQSHLCSLPKTIQPIIWNYDHCLHLYPIPHTDFIMMDPSSLYASSRNFSDQYGDMRLDIDDMSYEELLALRERIGNVDTGLSEDMISKCLTETKIYLDRNHEERTCCICLTRNATGLVATSIATGLGVLTHTLGTLVPVIRATGFAIATAATTIGTVVGSFR